jgi:hypothetical protein
MALWLQGEGYCCPVRFNREGGEGAPKRRGNHRALASLMPEGFAASERALSWVASGRVPFARRQDEAFSGKLAR